MHFKVFGNIMDKEGDRNQSSTNDVVDWIKTSPKYQLGHLNLK